ncbi:MAG TPA: thiamine diphosphokinase [Anaerolineae bacterium]|nr:thiamine diphosphokinase [Anaerolineae bacterium]
MRAVIIAAGRTNSDRDWHTWVRPGDQVIAADGGAARALARGIVPDLVVGDLDSLPAGKRRALEARGCRFLVHPRAKDETDLELALTYAAGQGAQEIIILGALGGRLDHALANLFLLAMPQLAGRSVRLVDGPDTALLLRSGEEIRLEGQPGDLVSLLPLGADALGITTGGLAWPLQGDGLRFAFSRGVSNEMTRHQATVRLDQGLLLVVHRAHLPAAQNPVSGSGTVDSAPGRVGQ